MLRTRYKIAYFVSTGALVILILALLVHGHTIAVFQPRGVIASKELHLMLSASLLMLIVVLAVFVMTFFIAWKYREGNKKAEYKPNWDHSRVAETIWWLVPIVLISVLAIITWQSSHDLDPFKPLVSNNQPMTIQVVALQWKWLFIYPDQHIATVNYVQFPVNTPVNFEITSDAPMNSFWIPQLGGQIYAMSGMSTQLHLSASSVGRYDGVSANLSGKGFSGMRFVAQAVPMQDYLQWLHRIKQVPHSLTPETYSVLAQPSEDNPIQFYGSVSPSLYDTILMKYTSSGSQKPMSIKMGMGQ